MVSSSRSFGVVPVVRKRRSSVPLQSQPGAPACPRCAGVSLATRRREHQPDRSKRRPVGVLGRGVVDIARTRSLLYLYIPAWAAAEVAGRIAQPQNSGCNLLEIDQARKQEGIRLADYGFM